MNKQDAIRNIVEFLTDDTSLDRLPSVDAIFVFGHIDPRIAQHAAHLYGLGKATKVIVSGKGRKEIEGYPTEAQYFADVLKKAGVPEIAIILEEDAMNSLENVRFAIDACHKIGFSPKSLILVAIPPLLRRSRATFEKQFPDIAVYGSAFEIPLAEYERWVKRLLAEFERFDEYAKKGDMKAIEIPSDVSESIQFLKALPESEMGEGHFYPKTHNQENDR